MKVLKKFQNVPVNVKIAGERKMHRDVMLVPTTTSVVFALRTGTRGRPRLVGQSEIEKITLANGSASKKQPVKKTKPEPETPKRRVVVVRKHK